MSQSKPDLARYLQECRSEIENRLDSLVQPHFDDPAGIFEAMRYSLLAGGKRLRAILMMAVADAIVGSHGHVVDAACALEMSHTYALIHDDLPCMDDDDFRRGKPTNHRVFGEAMAVLAGDGLLTLAFELLSRIPVEPPVTHERLLKCIAEISSGAGPEGMVGGQAMDIASSGVAGITIDRLQIIHSRKTGALFRAAVRAAAILSGASEAVLDSLSDYADALGLAFQIMDDILDVIGDEKLLGKPTGSDSEKGKATYPAIVGIEESRRLMDRAVASGHKALADAGLSHTILDEILDYVANRDH